MSQHRNNIDSPWDIEEAQHFLQRSADYEQTTDVDYNPQNFNLKRTSALLDALGAPHKKLRIIHVAGTKGKGTTCALLDSCLRKAGHVTGLFTSPHLHSICERIQVNGHLISEKDFCHAADEMKEYVVHKRQNQPHMAPTYFELLTAIAFTHFARKNVDWAVVEVGLGGRLDSTNVVQPECSMITAIGYDHTDKLGDTIQEIAGEKAGIIKDDTPVIIGQQTYDEARDVLRRAADDHRSPRWCVGEEIVAENASPLTSPPEAPDAPVGWDFEVQCPSSRHKNLSTTLLGRHQVDNCSGAVGALEMLRTRGRLDIRPEHISQGLMDCVCHARVEVLERSPAVVLDTAHTPGSMEALLNAIETHFPERTLHMVFGCSADKDYATMFDLLSEHSNDVILTQAPSPRAAALDRLERAARAADISDVDLVESPPDALDRARDKAGTSDVICVTGSFYVAGEIRI